MSTQHHLTITTPFHHLTIISHHLNTSPSHHLFNIHIQEVVVRILLHVQLAHLSVYRLAELVDVQLLLRRDEHAVLHVRFSSSSVMFSFVIGVRSSSSFSVHV